LLGWAREENPVREAALQALEARGGADVFIVLADLCVERGEESDFAALGAVARRMENRDEATRMIAERLASAPAERKDGLFSVLAQVGGAAGLDVVKPLLADAAQRAGAIQALADWSSADACPLILETAVAEGTSEEENVRLLQGLARLVREGRELGADARRGYALGGLNASRRDEERRSMLSLLAAAPHAESVAAILPHLQAEGSAIKEEAAAALVEIAAKLKESDGETAKGALEAVQSAAVSDDVKQRAAEVSSGG
jgi:hypothetical protein